MKYQKISFFIVFVGIICSYSIYAAEKSACCSKKEKNDAHIIICEQLELPIPHTIKTSIENGKYFDAYINFQESNRTDNNSGTLLQSLNVSDNTLLFHIMHSINSDHDNECSEFQKYGTEFLFFIEDIINKNNKENNLEWQNIDLNFEKRSCSKKKKKNHRTVTFTKNN